MGSWQRTFYRCPTVLEPLPNLDISGQVDIRRWLLAYALKYDLKWLLAHADDGVIWGRVDANGIVTSHDVAQGDREAMQVCPPLRRETMRQVRIFGQTAELLLWSDGGRRWQARVIRDASPGELTTWDEGFDEPQLLWGNRGKPLPQGFTFLRDAGQGLRYAIPMSVPIGKDDHVPQTRLLVRHYLNKEGFAQVVASRLIDIEWEGEE
ncbi:MAG: CRISPR-associated protein Csx19 [Firmicutes bacterium]|nr:CRISPR-associated protein Csx19 [Bacillota bacterium]